MCLFSSLAFRWVSFALLHSQMVISQHRIVYIADIRAGERGVNHCRGCLNAEGAVTVMGALKALKCSRAQTFILSA